MELRRVEYTTTMSEGLRFVFFSLPMKPTAELVAEAIPIVGSEAAFLKIHSRVCVCFEKPSTNLQILMMEMEPDSKDRSEFAKVNAGIRQLLHRWQTDTN